MALTIKKVLNEIDNSWDFQIKGEVDLDSSAFFRLELNNAIDEKKSNIKLNCEELTFIDSTGLGILINVHKKIIDEQYNITIVNPKNNISKLLNITGLNKLFIVV